MALSVRVGEVTFIDAACLKRLFPETDLSLEVSLALLVTDAGWIMCYWRSSGDA